MLCVAAGVVQGMITGIRGLCNGIGPAVFGFGFYLFHVDLQEPPSDLPPSPVSHNHTAMQDPYGKVNTNTSLSGRTSALRLAASRSS